MVGEVAAGAVTRALWASLLGDVMATRPLRASEGTRSWLRDALGGCVLLHGKHAPVIQLGS